MTKVIVLGQELNEQKKLKPIQFLHTLTESFSCTVAQNVPSDWKNIELIAKKYSNRKFDLMFAYDDNRIGGCLYLGHFNDGIV